MRQPRVLIIGLDCAAPSMVFDRYREQMPHLHGLMQRGRWGPLASTMPPITVPAWVSMTTGRDPGELGLYGFRQRKPGSYALRMSTAADVPYKRVWDWAGQAGKTVSALYVPLTSPPRALNGTQISGFLTPGESVPWTYPASLADWFTQHFGAYRADIDDFRQRDRAEVLPSLYAMTKQHFEAAAALWQRDQPDLMMLVDMGIDRFQHVFWQHVDPLHPRYSPHPQGDIGAQYYGFVDQCVGELLAQLDDDDLHVLVVSDHGAKALQGNFAINQWLYDQGWLCLRHPLADQSLPLRDCEIDWGRTRAWAEGGYYARVFINLEGREPEGCVASREYTSLRETLGQELQALTGPNAEPWHNRVLKPEEIYRQTRGLAPDLMVVLDDLNWRASGTLGHAGHYLDVNDTGADGCNHDWQGIAIMAGPSISASGYCEGMQLLDITPTVLRMLGLPLPTFLSDR